MTAKEYQLLDMYQIDFHNYMDEREKKALKAKEMASQAIARRRG